MSWCEPRSQWDLDFGLLVLLYFWLFWFKKNRRTKHELMRAEGAILGHCFWQRKCWWTKLCAMSHRTWWTKHAMNLPNMTMKIWHCLSLVCCTLFPISKSEQIDSGSGWLPMESQCFGLTTCGYLTHTQLLSNMFITSTSKWSKQNPTWINCMSMSTEATICS